MAFTGPRRLLLSGNMSAGPHSPATNPLSVLPVNVQQRDSCDWWKMRVTDFCPQVAFEYFFPFSRLRWKWGGSEGVGSWQRRTCANHYVITNWCIHSSMSGPRSTTKALFQKRKKIFFYSDLHSHTFFEMFDGRGPSNISYLLNCSKMSVRYELQKCLQCKKVQCDLRQ